MTPEAIKRVVDRQHAYFQSEKTFCTKNRKALLEKLHRVIVKYEDEICDALYKDLGKSKEESYMCEIGIVLNEIKYLVKHLDSFAKPKRVKTEIANFPAKSYRIQEPFGVVLIMSPWNYPFLLTMEPLAGAIAAGNTVLVKPSNYSPATSNVMKKILDEIFESGYVDVVLGGREENQALLEQKFDYIFFTGSPNVGRLVMEKASKHLTPISLELGGKSPVFVEKGANLSLSAKRLAYGKILNCGQTCIAPDYLLIEESIKDEFLKLLKKEFIKMLGEHPLDNPEYGRIVNEKHFARINGLVSSGKIYYGGKSNSDTLQIEPTILDGVTPEDPVMQEEIFGPILPVLTVKNKKEAESFILSRPKPLALYLFSNNKETINRFLKRVPFGGGCVNDTISHIVSEELHFGGVGESGMGNYHGRKSFETFSHEKGVVLRKGYFDPGMRYHPYTSKADKIIHFLFS